MHTIALKIHQFLEKVQLGDYKILDELLENFSNSSRDALKKAFEREPREFKLSMSNIGRPSCQLEFEAMGTVGEAQDNLVRFLYGNIAESILVFLIKASGITVVSEQEAVSLDINGTVVNGTLDLVLDLGDGPSVWDIKSASNWAFRNKFNPDTGFNKLAEDDSFGYLTQLYLYARAKGIKAGGFIIFDKSSGEIGVMEVPPASQDEYTRRALATANETITRIAAIKQHPVKLQDSYSKTEGNTELSEQLQLFQAKRLYSSISELFRGKSTNKKYLGSTCSFCKYRWQCWPGLTLESQTESKAKNPQMRYYVP